MERPVSPLLLVLLPTLAEGPMARAELSFARSEGGREVDLLVESAGAQLRARLAGSLGLRVEAGCGALRCRIAVDGLAPAVDAALPQLVAVPESPAPRLTPPERKQARRSWRGAWRRPATVLEAALHRLAEGATAPLGQRPHLGRSALAASWDASWAQARRLVVAGDYSAEALTAALAGREVGVVDAGSAGPPGSRANTRSKGASGLPILAVDWPDASRAQVALVWATDPAQAPRDQALAGDFQSHLVQALRETRTFTYDVSFDTFDTWAAASWDVRPESAWESLTVALGELWEQGRKDETSVREAAWRRLVLGRALLADTLPGRIAASSLGPLPPLPAAPFSAPSVIGAVVVADLHALTPEWQALPRTELDRCTLLYGANCPPGS